MRSLPEVADLLLVDAVHRHGSVGAAARELLVSQPSASQRLAALERRVGAPLFVRDTTGARPTAAGTALAAEAAHILGHLTQAFERSRQAVEGVPLRVGTFASFGPTLFAALDALLPQFPIYQLTDHGDRLMSWVGEGSLDVAVVAVAGQLPPAPGTIATPLGRDRLAVLTPAGVEPPGRGRRPLTGRVVHFHAVDMTTTRLHARIAELGGQPRRAASADVAAALARRRGDLALIGRCLALSLATPQEKVLRSPVTAEFAFSMVTRSPAPPELIAVLPALARAAGLVAS